MKKLGFGFMRMPVTNKNDESSVDHEQTCAMVDYFLEKGFTYFDTAYVYHAQYSEIALRKALVERHPREKFILADKMPIFSVEGPDDYQKFFDEQLEKCGVEYFDYYLLHNISHLRYDNTVKWGGFEFMKKVKASGQAKHIGFSFHDTADVLDKVLTNHPEMDFVQLQINYLDWESPDIQSRLCYEVAKKHGKPVIVMEPVKGGSLAGVPDSAEKLLKDYDSNASVPSWAIRYCASLDDVIMVLSGMSDIEQIKDNTGYMEEFIPLNETEKDMLAEVATIIKNTSIIPCTFCRYCSGKCPKNIPIHSYFSMYNQAKQFNKLWFQKMYYRNLSTQDNTGSASDCTKCGKCKKHCPQNINIPKYLKEVESLLKEEA